MSSTIKDIARETGVSIATVSRVLNNKGGYSEEVRKTVIQAAEKLEYRRNDAAASLVKRETKIIGIIMPNSTTQYYSNIVKGIEDYAAEQGYTVILTHSGVEGKRFTESFNLMVDRRVDGVIAFSITLEPAYLELIHKNDIPFLLISSQAEGISYVKVDDYSAAYEATTYLIKQGHQKIGLIGVNPEDIIAGKPRIEGYKKSLIDHQISVNEAYITTGDFNFNSGRTGMEFLIKHFPEITAVFCVSDEVALGALSMCKEKNREVPGEMSIMGYDNTDISWMVYPEITTVSQPFYEMGQKGCEKLIKKLQNERDVVSEVVSFEIIERDSVKKIS